MQHQGQKTDKEGTEADDPIKALTAPFKGDLEVIHHQVPEDAKG